MDDLDKLMSDLDRMSKNAEKLDGDHEFSFEDLFTNDFLNKYTSFKTTDDLLSAIPVDNAKSFDDFDKPVVDEIINKNSQFSSFTEMRDEAVEFYALNGLSNGTSFDIH
ncbi:RNA polymerase III [Lactiplantibacillus plantarum]|uniref:RNA polymerase III n=1 Tax=Lactiplantibacillus plantarum TaxID=1590 RepID=UPI00218246AC|nr:RNA polymerase III [Lactiplantibacillus plantarum]MCS8620187.1 RNA polymerase III [Lactiplantibacillus plantarum]